MQNGSSKLGIDNKQRPGRMIELEQEPRNFSAESMTWKAKGAAEALSADSAEISKKIRER
jgi:hypothetical protein